MVVILRELFFILIIIKEVYIFFLIKQFNSQKYVSSIVLILSIRTIYIEKV